MNVALPLINPDAAERQRTPDNIRRALTVVSSQDWELSRPGANQVAHGGGFALGLEILVVKTGITLEQFIEHQAQEARHERALWEARERHLAVLETNLRNRRAKPHLVGGQDA